MGEVRDRLGVVRLANRMGPSVPPRTDSRPPHLYGPSYSRASPGHHLAAQQQRSDQSAAHHTQTRLRTLASRQSDALHMAREGKYQWWTRPPLKHSWHALPNEIMDHVCSFLPISALHSASLVCGCWNTYIRDNEADWETRFKRFINSVARYDPSSNPAASPQRDVLQLIIQGGGWIPGLEDMEETESSFPQAIGTTHVIHTRNRFFFPPEPVYRAFTDRPYSWRKLVKHLYRSKQDWSGIDPYGRDLPMLRAPMDGEWEFGGDLRLFHRKGTHVTEMLGRSRSGRYREPVFYDWARTWDHVKEVYDQSKLVQTALKNTLTLHVPAVVPDCFWSWPATHRDLADNPHDGPTRARYPYDLLVHGRNESQILQSLLTASDRRCIKQYHRELFEEYLEAIGEPMPEPGSEDWVDLMHDFVVAIGHDEMQSLYGQLLDDRLNDARLLCAGPHGDVFNPVLTLALAMELFPEAHDQFKVVTNDDSAVVYWPQRNMVFDVCNYFAPDASWTAGDILRGSHASGEARQPMLWLAKQARENMLRLRSQLLRKTERKRNRKRSRCNHGRQSPDSDTPRNKRTRPDGGSSLPTPARGRRRRPR